MVIIPGNVHLDSPNNANNNYYFRVAAPWLDSFYTHHFLYVTFASFVWFRLFLFIYSFSSKKVAHSHSTSFNEQAKYENSVDTQFLRFSSMVHAISIITIPDSFYDQNRHFISSKNAYQWHISKSCSLDSAHLKICWTHVRSQQL